MTLFLLAACLAPGCASGPGPPPPVPLAVEVELAGCSALLAGPTCAVEGDTTLALWTKCDSTTVSVRIDGAPAEAALASVQGGTIAKVPVHAGSLGTGKVLSLHVRQGDREGEFRLSLRAQITPDPIREVDTLRRAFKLDEARKGLDAIDPGGDVGLRAMIAGRRARIDLAAGQSERAIALFGETIDLDRRAGRLSDELRDRAALSFVLGERGRFSEARAALAPLTPQPAGDSESRAVLLYHKGSIAHCAGDLRQALRSLQDAEEAAERVDLASVRLDAIEVRANVLSLLGRQAEARALLARTAEALPADADACRRAGLLTNIGWNLLDQASTTGESPEPFFEQAISLYRAACPNPSLLANVLVNLARARVAKGKLEQALLSLADARRAEPSPAWMLAAEELELDATIELERAGKNTLSIQKALARFEELGRLAERAVLWDARWASALGRARAHEALGDPAKALDAYAAAERVLDESSLLAPLGEGRALYLERRSLSARRYLALLARRDSPDAAHAARHARARALLSFARSSRAVALDPEQRRRWEDLLVSYRRERESLDEDASNLWTLSKSRLEAAPADEERRGARLRAALEQAMTALSWAGRAPSAPELERPRPDELFLVYYPAADDRWIGVAETSTGVRSRDLGPIDPRASPSDLSRALLDPFRREIESSRRIRFLPTAPLDAIDLHALPWDGAPLLVKVPVIYGVDVQAEAPRPPGPPPRGALLVIDPRGDLPFARAEGAWAAGELAQEGYEVATLSGEGATHAAVRDAVEKPDLALFHYAGHGVFRGRDGWESALPLSQNGSLTVGDVLALRSVPRVVILSGCETARTGDEPGASALGLSQAFVLVGASAVIAAPRRVDDRTTEKLMRRFLSELRASGDPAEALRRAEVAVRADGGELSGFRVVTP